MPVGDIEIPGISKEVVIAALFQSHVLWAAFVIGSVARWVQSAKWSSSRKAHCSTS